MPYLERPGRQGFGTWRKSWVGEYWRAMATFLVMSRPQGISAGHPAAITVNGLSNGGSADGDHRGPDRARGGDRAEEGGGTGAVEPGECDRGNDPGLRRAERNCNQRDGTMQPCTRNWRSEEVAGHQVGNLEIMAGTAAKVENKHPRRGTGLVRRYAGAVHRLGKPDKFGPLKRLGGFCYVYDSRVPSDNVARSADHCGATFTSTENRQDGKSTELVAPHPTERRPQSGMTGAATSHTRDGARLGCVMVRAWCHWRTTAGSTPWGENSVTRT